MNADPLIHQLATVCRIGTESVESGSTWREIGRNSREGGSLGNSFNLVRCKCSQKSLVCFLCDSFMNTNYESVKLLSICVGNSVGMGNTGFLLTIVFWQNGMKAKLKDLIVHYSFIGNSHFVECIRMYDTIITNWSVELLRSMFVSFLFAGIFKLCGRIVEKLVWLLSIAWYSFSSDSSTNTSGNPSEMLQGLLG